jgi:uncharacterized membrane protein YhfC
MDQLVVATFLIVGLAEVLLPLAVGYFLARRLGVKWSVFGWGVAFFVAIQIIHTPIIIVMQEPMLAWAKGAHLSPQVTLAIFAAVMGLLAGVFEEVGRYLVFKHFFSRKNIELSKGNALMFGAGWGGIESALVGFLIALTLFSYISASPLNDTQISEMNQSIGGAMTAEQVELMRGQIDSLLALTPLDLLPSLIERIMALILQITWTMMVYTAVVESKRGLLAIAIATHALVDAGSVYVGQSMGILPSELFVLVAAVIAASYLKGRLTPLAATSG